MQQQVTELIQAVAKADSAGGLLAAVETLAAARHEDAIPTLIEVLGYNNPGASVAAVDGLIALGEVAVSHLLENLDGYNYGARAWATRALAGIGDPRALDLLLEAVRSDFSLSVRRAAAKGLGIITWENLPEVEIPLKQKQVLETLLLVSEDSEWVVRYGAIVGLQYLALAMAVSQSDLVQSTIDKLRKIIDIEPELAVRTRIQLALKELA